VTTHHHKLPILGQYQALNLPVQYLIGLPIHNVDATFASGNGIRQSMYVSTIRLFDFHLPLASTSSFVHPFCLAYVAGNLQMECVPIGADNSEARKLVSCYFQKEALSVVLKFQINKDYWHFAEIQNAQDAG